MVHILSYNFLGPYKQKICELFSPLFFFLSTYVFNLKKNRIHITPNWLCSLHIPRTSLQVGACGRKSLPRRWCDHSGAQPGYSVTCLSTGSRSFPFITANSAVINVLYIYLYVLMLLLPQDGFSREGFVNQRVTVF